MKNIKIPSNDFDLNHFLLVFMYVVGVIMLCMRRCSDLADRMFIHNSDGATIYHNNPG